MRERRIYRDFRALLRHLEGEIAEHLIKLTVRGRVPAEKYFDVDALPATRQDTDRTDVRIQLQMGGGGNRHRFPDALFDFKPKSRRCARQHAHYKTEHEG